MADSAELTGVSASCFASRPHQDRRASLGLRPSGVTDAEDE